MRIENLKETGQKEKGGHRWRENKAEDMAIQDGGGQDQS